MIEFKWSKSDKTNTPVISADEMDELAEVLIKDYKPALLMEAQPIRYEHFLESYLGANLQYQDICPDKDSKSILGATAFNDELLRVYDRDKMLRKNILLNRSSVVLDNTLLEVGQEGRLLFTGLHEGGHWWMHKNVYTRDAQQMTLFEEESISQIVCCRSDKVENFISARRSTPEDWREYQADYLASAIAMPKSTFLKTTKEILKNIGIKGDRIVTGVEVDLDMFAEFEFPGLLADVFGVSKKAAEIKLKRFGVVTEKRKVIEETLQGRFI